MQKIDLGHITLNYSFEGDGAETVVLVNGLADDLLSWDAQMPALLGAGYRVLRYDNRGIGESDAPNGPYTSRMMADDLKALVEHLEIERFHLLGVSMGGMIVEEYALAYPGDVISLILACTYAAPDGFCTSMFNMWGDLARAISPAFVMRDVMLWAFTGPFFDEQPEVAAEFAAAMAQLPMSTDAYLSQLNVIQQHDVRDRLGDISLPTLVLAGEEDILIPVRLSRQMCGQIPGAKWKTVPGGHACMWEIPDPFNEAIVEFFAQVNA